MDDSVRAEYESILAEIVIERGRLVQPGQENRRFGGCGWEDYDNYNDNPHLSGCRVTEHGTPVEVTWEEFAGTFADPTHDTHHGVDLPGVTCACGHLRDRTLRMDRPVQKVIEDVFTKLYHRLTVKSQVPEGEE